MSEKFIVLDTETTNSIDDPICYDMGWAVVDKDGNVFQTYSFVVADVFLDRELMESAYFKEKIPTYWEQIKSGERILASGYLVEGPTWSPNGRVLMFFRQDRGSPVKLYTIDLTGYNERRVITPTDASDPAWSPLLKL